MVLVCTVTWPSFTVWMTANERAPQKGYWSWPTAGIIISLSYLPTIPLSSISTLLIKPTTFKTIDKMDQLMTSDGWMKMMMLNLFPTSSSRKARIVHHQCSCGACSFPEFLWPNSSCSCSALQDILGSCCRADDVSKFRLFPLPSLNCSLISPSFLRLELSDLPSSPLSSWYASLLGSSWVAPESWLVTCKGPCKEETRLSTFLHLFFKYDKSYNDIGGRGRGRGRGFMTMHDGEIYTCPRSPAAT